MKALGQIQLIQIKFENYFLMDEMRAILFLQSIVKKHQNNNIPSHGNVALLIFAVIGCLRYYKFYIKTKLLTSAFMHKEEFNESHCIGKQQKQINKYFINTLMCYLLGMFCDNDQKFKNDPNLSLDSLEVIICGEYQAQNSHIL